MHIIVIWYKVHVSWCHDVVSNIFKSDNPCHFMIPCRGLISSPMHTLKSIPITAWRHPMAFAQGFRAFSKGFSKIVRDCQVSLLILQLCFIHWVLTKWAWGSKTCNLPCHSVPIYLQVGKPGHPKYLSPNDVCYGDWANSLPHLLDGLSLCELDLLLHNFF